MLNREVIIYYFPGDFTRPGLIQVNPFNPGFGHMIHIHIIEESPLHADAGGIGKKPDQQACRVF